MDTPTAVVWSLIAVLMALLGFPGRGRQLAWLGTDHRCPNCGSTGPVGDRRDFAIRLAPRPVRSAPGPAPTAASPGVSGAPTAPGFVDRRVVVESLDATLLWDVETEAPVSHLVPWVLPEGRSAVAVGTASGVVHVVDLVTGTPVCSPLVGAAEPIRALAALPTAAGAPLLVTLQGKQLRWWEAPSGRLVGEPVSVGLASALAAVWGESLGDGRWMLAVGDQHGVVSLWDPIRRTRSGEILRRSGHPVEVLVGSGPRGGAAGDERGGELAASYRSRDGVDVWSPAARGSGPGPVLVGPDRQLVLGTGGVVGLAFLPQSDGGPDPVVVARRWLGSEDHTTITGVTVLPREQSPPVIVTVGSPQFTMRLWRPDTGDVAVLGVGVRPRCVAGLGATAVVGHDRGVRGFVLGEDLSLRRGTG